MDERQIDALVDICKGAIRGLGYMQEGGCSDSLA